MVRLKVIACDVFNREISYLSSLSKCYVDICYLNQGLHDKPDTLRESLQEQVNLANQEFPRDHFKTGLQYDYIILAYGLCSNGIIGVTSEKNPLIIPRGHDCCTLLLGSKERYKAYFNEHSGTYWYSRGWIERAEQPGEDRIRRTYQRYMQKYGEDNAEYLMEMEQGWMKKYDRATYIEWTCLGNSEFYRAFTKECADFMHWHYDELMGDHRLLERILNGIFDETEVLIVPPGRKAVPSHDDTIIALDRI